MLQEITQETLEKLADMPAFTEETYNEIYKYAEDQEEFMQIRYKVWAIISNRKLRIKIRQSIRPFQGVSS